MYQISQAELMRYVVLRQLEFDKLRLPAALVAHLLNATVALHASVAPSAASVTR